ncbi:MAG: flagellar basal body P-ring protein FlgI [Rickettsiales bacterium]|nr:MAG: flagellar basal body P-ring protein FlgI [Rickettsiales bacterium]
MIIIRMRTSFAIFFILISYNTYASSRIKDIVTIEGVRDNLLIGHGLVVGLNGSGDNLNNTIFTQKGLIDTLERLGVNTKGSNLKTKNVAAVTITATLPPFSRAGNRIDIVVSTLGDAKSLQGGTLLAAPMLGADGEVYAVAQGQISLGGFNASGKTLTVNKGVLTNGFISNGAIVEKEINFKFNSLASIKLALKNPDISTAIDIASKINNKINSSIAKATDPGTVELNISNNYKNNIVNLLAQIEQIKIEPDQVAKIIIDEASGTIVIGDNVRISPVAISQGNLTVIIDEQTEINQPEALSIGGSTIVTPSTKITIDDEMGKKLQIIEEGTTLRDLVHGLNSLGVSPRDLITILQNIKALGALQAEIETR